MFMIPDESAKITLAKKKYKFDSMEALKKEVNIFEQLNQTKLIP